MNAQLKGDWSGFGIRVEGTNGSVAQDTPDFPACSRILLRLAMLTLGPFTSVTIHELRGRPGRFRLALRVATEVGPSHPVFSTGPAYGL